MGHSPTAIRNGARKVKDLPHIGRRSRGQITEKFTEGESFKRICGENVIESPSRKTTQLLVEAVQRGAAETVAALIDAGADINARTPNGRTPLMFAAVTGNVRIVEMLLKSGADVNAQALDGSTALIKACLWGHADTVEQLLAYGADRELESDDGWTPVSIAVQQGQDQIIRLLNEECANQR